MDVAAKGHRRIQEQVHTLSHWARAYADCDADIIPCSRSTPRHYQCVCAPAGVRALTREVQANELYKKQLAQAMEKEDRLRAEIECVAGVVPLRDARA
jgi:hypothetical protein